MAWESLSINENSCRFLGLPLVGALFPLNVGVFEALMVIILRASSGSFTVNASDRGLTTNRLTLIRIILVKGKRDKSATSGKAGGL